MRDLSRRVHDDDVQMMSGCPTCMIFVQLVSGCPTCSWAYVAEVAGLMLR